MRATPFLLAFLTVLLAGFAAFTVRLEYFEVALQDNDFVVTWEARTEEDAQAYELFRKTAYDEAYELVVSVPSHGTGKEYRFVDDQVYKAASEQVDYRLDVVYTNGLRQQLAERNMNYTPTYVRRTWGSIKAMFQ